MKILEVTSNNADKYINQIVDLEQEVVKLMENSNKSNYFFATGKEDITDYTNSKENTVLVLVDDDDKVQAATYITQGQKLFTYNDITKYFKALPEYKDYVKNSYADINEYKRDALDAYKLKMKAYLYAREELLKEYPQFKSLYDFMQSEINSQNRFDEKSPLREKLNTYMYDFIVKNNDKKQISNYEKFYFMTLSDINELIYGKEYKMDVNPIFNELEKELMISNSDEKEQEHIMRNANFLVYEQSNFDVSQYFTANPNNSVEIDTYMTSPNMRNNGKARVIVYEGIKKHIEKFFENKDNNEIFLCSTLHRNNLSSKYVSEFFELKDNLYVKRREGREREVHITRVSREEKDNYLNRMEEKIAVLYGYNPNNLQISPERRKQIIRLQRDYELKEYGRLKDLMRGYMQLRGYEEDSDVLPKKANKIMELRKQEMDLRNQENDREL